MPTQEQLRRWLEQVFSLVADATVGGSGTTVSIAAGGPDITCAYLIDLVNRRLRQIAYETAVNMSPAQAAAYQRLQRLRDEILEACDQTEVAVDDDTDAIPQPDGATPQPDDPGPVTTTPDPKPDPDPPEPDGPTGSTGGAPTQAETPTCCAIHGNELPDVDTDDFEARVVRDGVILSGTVRVSHPCGLSTLETEIWVYWPGDRKTRLHRERSNRLETLRTNSRDLGYRPMPIRGARSGYLLVRATSACGRTVRVVLSPFGRNAAPVR